MDYTIKRYIITGAPGTGKSSVLEALSNKGYACYPEVSRVIICEQQKTGGNLLPWENLEGFAKACYQKMYADFKNAEQSVCFYDRGIPDIIAYLENRNLPVDNEYYNELDKYEKEVFFLPVCPKIFINDPQRPESIEQAYSLEKSLQKVYKQLGFRLCTMSFSSINERVNEIETLIKK